MSSGYRFGVVPVYERELIGIAPDDNPLPYGLALEPLQDSGRSHLDALLNPQSLEDSLLAPAIQPELDDRQVLLPAVFQQALEAAASHFRAVGTRLRPHDPETANQLDGCCDILAWNGELAQLLRMFRNALLAV